MTIRITGDGPKITATGSGSTVLVEISTGQHDPGSFSGVHNDLTGRSTTGAHVGTAVSIDPTGFNGNLDGTIVNAQLLAAAVDELTTGGGGGGGAVDSVDGRTGVVTLDDLYQTVGVEIATVDTTLVGPPRTVITAIDGGTVTLPTATAGDVGQHWHISTGPYELTVVGCDGGDVTVPVGMVLSVVGFEAPGPVYGWAQLGFKTIDAPTSGGADLSDTTPQALGTAAAGTGTAAARDDHVHAMPTAADVGADADGAAQAVADTLGTAATKDAGSAGGVAELDVTGKVPSAQLPSYVDDVVEVANFAALPGTGETGKIYVTVDTNVTYRWSGSAYVEISASLALGETSSTAYRGDRGKTAYDHSQVVSGNPHGTTAADVGAQPVDAELTAIAGLTSAADRLPYFTSSGTASLATFTSAGRALVDDATVAAQRTTLELSAIDPLISPIIGGTKYPVWPMGSRSQADANQAANKIRALAFPMSITWNLEEVWVHVTSAAAAGKNLRMGLWSLTNSWVPTLLWDSGSIAADSLGTKKATSIGLTGNPPGRYMLGFLAEATTGVRLFGAAYPTWAYATSAPASTGVGLLEFSHTYGTLPTTPTLAATASDHTYFPLLMVTSA